MPDARASRLTPSRLAPDERSQRYPAVLRTLHWLIVALVIAQFAVAWTMPGIHRGTPPVGLVGWHLSIGTVILAVMLVRLGWRMTHAIPPVPTTLPPGVRVLSRTTHYLLYTLLIVLPLLGWANASARGWTIRLFDTMPMPALLARGSDVGMALGDVHATIATVLLAVIALHVSGALYHALVLRDGTIRRIA